MAFTYQKPKIKMGDLTGMSMMQIEAHNYIVSRHIEDFFHFMVHHLLCNEPENPVEFLINLVNQCLEYRADPENKPPPLLFTPAHVNSMYHALDPAGIGKITNSQYVTGLVTLGLKNFNLEPKPCVDECVCEDRNMVAKETFIDEANKGLKNALEAMLALPEPLYICPCDEEIDFSVVPDTPLRIVPGGED